MGVYSERFPARWQGFLILALAFVVIYGLWMTPARELYRQEGAYAAAAVEYHFPRLRVAVHGADAPRVMPLMPALAGVIYRSGLLPMESVLRLISIFFLGAGAVLVYFAAAGRRTHIAGLCAAAMYIGTVLTIDKSINGDPVSAGAFFLLTAQLSFFRFGVNNGNWNLAWILAGLSLTAGYLACGLIVPLFFIVPCFFFRRPLSVRSKLNLPGFFFALILLGGVFFFRNISIFDRMALPRELTVWSGFSTDGYWLDVLSFLPYIVVRLLPWCLIAWLPFCVALQALDTTPVLGLYLRTLVLVSLVLLWILPGHDSRYVLFLLGPLAILTGRTYELGMRRYGRGIRRTLAAVPYLVFGLIPAVGAACLLPESWLTPFISVSNSMEFRNAPGFHIFAWAAVGILLLTALVLYFDRRRFPVWTGLLLAAMAIGVFNSVILLPYRAQEQSKRRFGEDLRQAVMADAGGPVTIRTLNVSDLHGGLFYSGFPVRAMTSAADMPGGEEPVIYMLGTSFPAVPERSWSNLLPVDYLYRERHIALWKGVWRDLDKEGAGKAAGGR